ncbi:MAG TPA: hypothetical protein VKZ79_05115 [Alphaproteobacteria bacterium]|nr:hypothetical protein [Alphaproteobacteria bacterium]
MAGSKTHEEFRRTLERKAGPSANSGPGSEELGVGGPSPEVGARAAQYAAGERTGRHESAHNKHNHPPKGAPKH